MGKHPKIRWREATMKGKLQKFFLARPEMSKKQPEVPDDNNDESNETEIFRIRIESKEQKEIGGGVTKVGFSQAFVHFMIPFFHLYFISPLFRLYIFY
jgi:hypothetical protein